MKRTIIPILAAILMTTATAHAIVDVSSDSNEDIKTSGEKGVSTKGTIDKKKSTTTKTSKTRATSKDRSASASDKTTGQANKTGALDMTVSADIMFLRHLRHVEEQGIEPFASCGVVSRPKLAADFGLSSDTPDGIDTVKAGYLSKLASSNGRVSAVTDEGPIRHYRDCIATYGAVIKTAFLNLNDYMARVSAKTAKSVKGEVEVKDGLGYDDFLVLAQGAIARAVAEVANLPGRYSDILTNEPCRFAGSLDKIQCGPAELTLATKPTLMAAGFTVYGNSYGGFGAQYKLSSGWSLTTAYEKAKTTSLTTKEGRELVAAVENAESRGQTVEAMTAKKKVVDLSRSKKASISPGKVLPGVN